MSSDSIPHLVSLLPKTTGTATAVTTTTAASTSSTPEPPVDCVDLVVAGGTPVQTGSLLLLMMNVVVLATPGHTWQHLVTAVDAVTMQLRAVAAGRNVVGGRRDSHLLWKLV